MTLKYASAVGHMRAHRDAATAATIEKIWRPVRWVGNLVSSWKDEQTDAALVVADALIENGYSKVGTDLSRFAKRMQKWKKLVPFYGYHQSRVGPQPPKWNQWTSIAERVDAAIEEIRQKKPGSREWHQKSPHQAIIVFRPNYLRPRIEGPFPVSPRDLEDITTIRRWFARIGQKPLGRLYKSWRGGRYHPFERQGANIILRVYPGSSITIEPGQTKPRSRGREIQEIAEALTRYHFLRPNQYARMLHRHGYTSERTYDELRLDREAFATRFNFRRTS